MVDLVQSVLQLYGMTVYSLSLQRHGQVRCPPSLNSREVFIFALTSRTQVPPMKRK